MEAAMAYERRKGSTPTDVSAENLGFDMRHEDEKIYEIRYIELEGGTAGPVALTQDEWFRPSGSGRPITCMRP